VSVLVNDARNFPQGPQWVLRRHDAAFGDSLHIAGVVRLGPGHGHQFGLFDSSHFGGLHYATKVLLFTGYVV
jgi:hypothetical protein